VGKRSKLAMAMGTVVVFILITVCVLNDYHDWVQLGPGGLPHTLRGWAQVTFFRVIQGDPFDADVFSGDMGNATDVAALNLLPPRAGARPVIARHPVPHRQLDQQGEPPVRTALNKEFRQMVAERQAVLTFMKRL